MRQVWLRSALPGHKTLPRLIGALLAMALAVLPTRLHADEEELDLTGQAVIRDHIDKQLAELDLATLDDAQKHALLVDPLCLNLNMIVPVYGSYILDTTLYGAVQYPAVIADWLLGGLVPLALTATALLGQAAFGELPRNIMLGSALALYLGTRVAVLLVINEHIHVYNDYMREQLGLPGTDAAGAE